jgi:hypothetical protein
MQNETRGEDSGKYASFSAGHWERKQKSCVQLMKTSEVMLQHILSTYAWYLCRWQQLLLKRGLRTSAYAVEHIGTCQRIFEVLRDQHGEAPMNHLFEMRFFTLISDE